MGSRTLVVTPTYCTEDNGRLPLLLQTIYWVQQQTHRDFMHVIVDDGSTDKTPELLEMIAHHTPSLSVYHKSNGGSSAAVNYGIERALKEFTPDFITIHHSDDLLPPSSLDDRVKLANETGARFVYSDQVNFFENGRDPILSRARHFPDAEALYDSLIRHEAMQYPTMLWDSRFFLDRVRGYDKRLTSGEDWEIAIRSARELCNVGGKHAGINKVTVAYRKHDRSVSGTDVGDGTKWKCYKMIVAKHMKGRRYQYELAKCGINVLRAMLPERMKKPLRYVRNIMLSSSTKIPIPYRGEFLDKVREINYEREVMPDSSKN